MENRVRSLAKAITWRTAATFITTLLVFLFTGSAVISAGVGALEFTLKMFFYYLHERIWNIFSFGRENSTVDTAKRGDSLKNTLVKSPEDDDDAKLKSP